MKNIELHKTTKNYKKLHKTKKQPFFKIVVFAKVLINSVVVLVVLVVAKICVIF